MTLLFLFLSVLIGVVLVLLIKPSKLVTQLLLAFSGAYLLSVTILHLLPEVYESASNTKMVGICILIGIILQSVLESFSKGAEHGHIHLHSDANKFPYLLYISLSFHAFTEGIPIHHAGDNLLWAIVVHKIPIAIVLTSYLLHANYSKQKIVLFLGTFALMSPLGALLSEQLMLFEKYIMEITAIIIGVFLHISTIILFESTENHKFNLKKFTAIILGVILTIITL